MQHAHRLYGYVKAAQTSALLADFFRQQIDLPFHYCKQAQHKYAFAL